MMVVSDLLISAGCFFVKLQQGINLSLIYERRPLHDNT